MHWDLSCKLNSRKIKVQNLPDAVINYHKPSGLKTTEIYYLMSWTSKVQIILSLNHGVSGNVFLSRESTGEKLFSFPASRECPHVLVCGLLLALNTAKANWVFLRFHQSDTTYSASQLTNLMTTLDSPRWPRLPSQPQGQLMSNINSTCNLNSFCLAKVIYSHFLCIKT